MWRHVWPHFADDHRVLMPDLRGHGLTEAPGHGMDPDTFARDQIALLDALHVDRVFLIGHDWGGYTGFLLAARHPDRVRGYLACNTPHPWVQLRPALVKEAWRTLYAWVLASPLGPPLLRRTDLVRRSLLREARGRGFTEADLDAFAGQWRAPQRARATQLLYRSYLPARHRALAGARARAAGSGASAVRPARRRDRAGAGRGLPRRRVRRRRAFRGRRAPRARGSARPRRLRFSALAPYGWLGLDGGGPEGVSDAVASVLATAPADGAGGIDAGRESTVIGGKSSVSRNW